MDSNMEQEDGCAKCGENRRLLERAWQTVANEYYDPYGRFSQAKWAQQLLAALQVFPLMLPLPGALRGQQQNGQMS